MTAVLTQNEYVKVTLSDGVELVLSTEGWQFDGFDIPRSMPVTETTGRSGQRSYLSQEVHDYTFPFTIRYIDGSTEKLADEVGKTLTWEQGLEGSATGSAKRGGSILMETVQFNSTDEVLMMTIAAQGTLSWVEGTF